MLGETLSFDLAIDEFNADRYLPPAADEPQEAEGSLDEVDLPLEFLRGLDANGRFAIGSLQFDGLTFSDLALDVSANDGRIRLTPSAGLYGGTYAGAIGIDVQDDTALLTLQQELASVDVATLMLDYLELEMFTNVGEVMRALDGDVSFALSDGTWEGVDVWQQMRRARATFEQEDAPPAPDGEPRTPFSSISASGVIEDAVLTNDDLTASFDFMTIAGAGVVELLNDSMNLDVTATFNDNELLQSDPLMADLAGDSLPLTVTGSLAAPTVRPDFNAMVRAEVEEAVDEAIEEEREELEERLQDRLRGIFDR
jgi:AsmA protein